MQGLHHAARPSAIRWVSKSLATLSRNKEAVLHTRPLASHASKTRHLASKARLGQADGASLQREICSSLKSIEPEQLSNRELFLVTPHLPALQKQRRKRASQRPDDTSGQDDGAVSAPSEGKQGSGDGDSHNSDFSFAEALSDSRPQRVMEHYFELKLKYPAEYLLLYQIGDFYEFYGQDAERASMLLDITLTSKLCLDPAIPGAKNGRVAFTGFQIRSLDCFLERLIKAGCSAAICDQMPLTGPFAKIQRRVARVVTPGTLTEENLLEKGAHNYLLAIAFEQGKTAMTVGLAWMDLSTGLYVMTECKEEEFKNHYVRLRPREIVVDREDANYQQSSIKRLLDLEAGSGTAKGSATRLSMAHAPREHFDPELAKKRLGEFLRHKNAASRHVAHLPVHTIYDFSSAELSASGALLHYVNQTQLDRTPYIEFPVLYTDTKSLRLDGTSLQSLEILTHAQSGERHGSLLNALDATLTASGARLLVERLQHPLLSIQKINARLDMVERLIEHRNLLADLRDILKDVPDFERSVQRLCLNRSQSGPKDMISVKKAIIAVSRLKARLEVFDDKRQQLGQFEGLAREIEMALEDPPPSKLSEGKLIKDAYDTELHGSELAQSRSTLAGAAEAIKGLQSRYIQLTGKAALKIVEGRSGMLVCSRSVLSHELFRYHSQITSGFRYTTAELNDLQMQFSEAESEKNEKELQIYEKLRIRVTLEAEGLKEMARVVAELDVASTMAQLALQRSYHRPTVQLNTEFCIVNGRHPVIEEIHQASSRQFIKNDCQLGPESRFWFITGPNMGGKSTFLRQNALIVIMAQCGFYVPADSATIGIVDAIYTRIGAGDDLSKDQSTFMTEMKETAVILSSASPASLVIMDEVGRGTSPDEGLALAWAICSHLLGQNKCRTLFATHYLQLGELMRQFPHVACQKTGAVRLSRNQVDFTQKLEPGIAEASHGIDVAERADIPILVIQAAREKHKALKKTTSLPSVEALPPPVDAHASSALSIAASPELTARAVQASKLAQLLQSRLLSLSIDEITGRQAINFLYDLRDEVLKL